MANLLCCVVRPGVVALGAFLFLASPRALAQAVHTVPGDFVTIQAAIEAAQAGDEVLVAPGVYVERIDYLGKDLVVRGQSGAQVTVLDAAGLGTAVTFAGGESSFARFEGFTVTRGVAPGSGGPGGVSCAGASPTIVGCLFTRNEGRDGGGGAIGVDGGTPTVLDCAFEDNLGGGGRDYPFDGGAGAIQCSDGSLVVERCAFRRNVGGRAGETTHFAFGGPGAIRGNTGGPDTVAIRDCTFEENRGGAAGASRDCLGGAGAVDIESGYVIEDSRFLRNVGGPGERAEDKGGVGAASLGSGTVHRCQFLANRGGHVLDGGWYGGTGALFMDRLGEVAHCVFEDNVGGAAPGTQAGLAGGAGAIEARIWNPVIRDSLLVGNRGGDSYRFPGAGVFDLTNASDIVIERCTIRANRGGAASESQAEGGAGVVSSHGSPRFADCLIEDNVGGAAARYGGSGVLQKSAGAPLFERCVLRRNTGASGITAGHGVMRVQSSSTLFRACTIEENSGGDGGEGSGDRAGAGVAAATGGEVRFEACTILRNRGGNGGLGDYDRGGAGALAAEDNASLVIVNSVLRLNVGGGAGETASGDFQSFERGGAGAIQLLGTGNSVVTHCIVASNVAGQGPADMDNPGGVLVKAGAVTNSIVVDNVSSGGPADMALGALGSARHCCVGHDVAGEGNFVADPLLVDLADGDYHLDCASPCVDAGSSAAPELPATDFEGENRIFGHAPDVGVDEASVVTLGQSGCISSVNSSGSGAHLSVNGSGQIDDTCFTLRADHVTGVGSIFYGPSLLQVTFGDGVRCVGSPVQVLPPVRPIASTLITRINPLGAPGPITPGSTWHFQAWYRDPQSSGAGFNTSDSVSVSFLP